VASDAAASELMEGFSSLGKKLALKIQALKLR
jgi:hypothetical protein